MHDPTFVDHGRMVYAAVDDHDGLASASQSYRRLPEFIDPSHFRAEVKVRHYCAILLNAHDMGVVQETAQLGLVNHQHHVGHRVVLSDDHLFAQVWHRRQHLILESSQLSRLNSDFGLAELMWSHHVEIKPDDHPQPVAYSELLDQIGRGVEFALHRALEVDNNRIAGRVTEQRFRDSLWQVKVSCPC